MKYLILLAMALSLAACKKSAEPERTGIIGRWKHSETRISPGNGLGDWQPVSAANAQVIRFGADSSLQANGLWALQPYTRFRNLTANSFEVYNSSSSATIYYEFDNGLVLHFTCIEPCADRFVAVD
jgi:hypothetical protein